MAMTIKSISNMDMTGSKGESETGILGNTEGSH